MARLSQFARPTTLLKCLNLLPNIDPSGHLPQKRLASKHRRLQPYQEDQSHEHEHKHEDERGDEGDDDQYGGDDSKDKDYVGDEERGRKAKKRRLNWGREKGVD